jgi:hypothetical protein
MKLTIALLLVSGTVNANYCGPYDNWRPDCQQQRETTIYPTYPGSNARDWGQPAIVIERNERGQDEVYKTLPGSNMRDYRRPAIIIDGND